MSRKQIKKTKTVLKRKLKVLQSAHDYIEANGFDIQEYNGKPDETDGKIVTPRCYIGTVRTAAEVSPQPRDGEGFMGPADTDDGPELTLALETLDKEVKTITLYKEQKDNLLPYLEEMTDEGNARYQYPGRFVEGFGLYLNSWNGYKLTEDKQQEIALKLFRKAIRNTVKEIEALG